MKYFKLSHETDSKVIGTYPPCKAMPAGKGYTSSWFDRANSFSHLTNKEYPDIEPDFIWELEENAKLTDVVIPSNVSARGFLINGKVKEIFSHYDIMQHRVYSARLIVDGNELLYYWVHFKENREVFLRSIDYQKSSFIVVNLAYKKEYDIEINSYDEFKENELNLDFQYLSASRLYFESESPVAEIDLFYLGYFFLDFLISEQLAEVLKTNNITGLKIKEQDVL